MYIYNKKLKGNAQQLRKNMTPEEKMLWYQFLKRLPFPVKRQKQIENYIVDFYIPKAKMVIELDGIQHNEAENRLADQKRDARLKELGISVLRFSNDDIRESFLYVTEHITELLGLKGVIFD